MGHIWDIMSFNGHIRDILGTYCPYFHWNSLKWPFVPNMSQICLLTKMRRHNVPFFFQCIPKLITYKRVVFDCHYLTSCHILSSVLSSSQIIGITPLDELKELAYRNLADKDYENENHPQINRDSLDKHIAKILQVDPQMYCWTNFHLSYLYSHCLVVGKNPVSSLDSTQRKIRLKAWYYVIIFLCRRMTTYPELLDSSYLRSVVQCINNILSVKSFALEMTKRNLETKRGIDTRHWHNIETAITAYSNDDN